MRGSSMVRTVATWAAGARGVQPGHSVASQVAESCFAPVVPTRRHRMAGLLALTRHRAVALVAAGVVAGAAGGVVISQLGTAGAASPSPTPSRDARDGLREHFGHGPGGMGLLGGLGGGNVLHGEATIEKPGGGTTVVHFQHGVISAISGSTMTVKSTDGFTSSFTVNGTTRISLNGTDGTLSKLATSDKVRVFGVEDGSATVARMVLDGVPGRGMFGGRLGGGLAHRFAHRMMTGA